MYTSEEVLSKFESTTDAVSTLAHQRKHADDAEVHVVRFIRQRNFSPLPKTCWRLVASIFNPHQKCVHWLPNFPQTHSCNVRVSGVRRCGSARYVNWVQSLGLCCRCSLNIFDSFLETVVVVGVEALERPSSCDSCCSSLSGFNFSSCSTSWRNWNRMMNSSKNRRKPTRT